MMTALDKSRREGKADEYAKVVGGFAVAKMGDGTFDWFPTGQPPQKDGEVDHEAVIVEKWLYNIATKHWRQIA